MYRAEGNFEFVSRYVISKLLQYFQTLVLLLPLMLIFFCSFCPKADLNRQFGDITAETKCLVLSTIRHIVNKSDPMALCLQETASMYNLWTACQESNGNLTQMMSTCIFS